MHGANFKTWYRQNQYGWTPALIAEGHRPGNFKPSAETLSALHQELLASSITPPKPTPRTDRKGYHQC